MNMKNILFSALMIGATFTSSVVVAGVPSIIMNMDKIIAAGGVGMAGLGIGGYIGVQKGFVVGGGGYLRACAGGVVGAAVGGGAGVVIGYVGCVVLKALHNEFIK